jgi:hypothetical protein
MPRLLYTGSLLADTPYSTFGYFAFSCRNVNMLVSSQSLCCHAYIGDSYICHTCGNVLVECIKLGSSQKVLLTLS